MKKNDCTYMQDETTWYSEELDENYFDGDQEYNNEELEVEEYDFEGFQGCGCKEQRRPQEKGCGCKEKYRRQQMNCGCQRPCQRQQMNCGCQRPCQRQQRDYGCQKPCQRQQMNCCCERCCQVVVEPTVYCRTDSEVHHYIKHIIPVVRKEVEHHHYHHDYITKTEVVKERECHEHGRRS